MHKSDMALFESLADRMIAEKAPPGWAGTVKAMKKHMSDDKAFALAWDGYKKGKEPHYKDDGSTVNGKKPEKKKKYQNEENMDDLEEAMKHGSTPKGKEWTIFDKKSADGQKVKIGFLGTKTAVKGKDKPEAWIAIGNSMYFLSPDAASKIKADIEVHTAKEVVALVKKHGGKKASSSGLRNVKEDVDSNGEQQDDEFETSVDELQKSIAQKLGGMSCGDSVMSLIGTMYDAGDLPAAAYATAAGMSRAEQELSHSSAKAMNQMAPDVLAGAIVRGMRATSSPTIKSAAAWWKGEIGSLDADRGGSTHTANNTGPSSAAAVQPSIDYMATEELDARFDAAVLPIGAGALSDPASCMMSPYPAQMAGEAGSVEHGVDRAAAQASIVGGRPRSLKPARPARSLPALPGENRVNPGRYTAESFDALSFEERVRIAEAYDRLMGGASDLSRDERVDAEAYAAMLAGAHSNPQGTGTPVATMSQPHPDKVVVNDLDTAFDTAAK